MEEKKSGKRSLPGDHDKERPPKVQKTKKDDEITSALDLLNTLQAATGLLSSTPSGSGKSTRPTKSLPQSSAASQVSVANAEALAVTTQSAAGSVTPTTTSPPPGLVPDATSSLSAGNADALSILKMLLPVILSLVGNKTVEASTAELPAPSA